jgi:hypothetical protein
MADMLRFNPFRLLSWIMKYTRNPSKKINTWKLYNEIQGDEIIETPCLSVSYTPNQNNLYIDMASDISSTEESQLDAIIIDHNDVANLPWIDDEFKIHDYIINENYNKYEIPYQIDYNILWFKKERVFNKGMLMSIKYRWSYDISTNLYSDLIVREDNLYNRNDYWFLSDREKTISWFKKDGSIGDDRITHKYYNSLEAVVVDDKARSYILDKMKFDTIWLISQTDGIWFGNAKDLWLPFVTECAIEMAQYRDGDRQPLINKISNYDTEWWTKHAWLDNDIWINNPSIPGNYTIRTYVVSNLQP